MDMAIIFLTPYGVIMIINLFNATIINTPRCRSNNQIMNVKQWQIESSC
jgi:hypothetical protein